MADDDLTTANDMLEMLFKAMEYCLKELDKNPAPLDKNQQPLEVYCPGEWDKLICWPSSPPGVEVKKKCPHYIIDFNQDGYAYRQCEPDGTWMTVRGNQTLVDYQECNKYLMSEDVLKEQLNQGDPRIRSMITLYTVGYSFSLVALTFAMIILAYFQRLHCTRNYIHMHLFASFMLRAIVIFVKDKVVFIGSGIMDVQNQEDMSLLEMQGNMMQNKVGCRVVITLFHYFLATNYYWILVEALYLHSLIFVAFFSDKKYLFRFTLTGWGVPILFVGPWVIVRALLKNEDCWDIPVPEYAWIYNGPIVVANVINFLLFLNIIRVLWYKMKERGAIRRTDNRRQYKKLAKSTLVLIPMFGVHAIVFIGMPDDVQSGIWWDIRMYFDLFFNSFQGFFVAIIYCFCNGEVQAEFKKAWERFNLSVEMQKGRRERSRSSVTMLTSFNSSGSHQARLSIGGANGRGSIKPIGASNGSTMYSNGNSTHDTRVPLLNKQISLTTETETTNFNAACVGQNSCYDVLISDACSSPTEIGNTSFNGENATNLLPLHEANCIEEKEFEQALDGVYEEEMNKKSVSEQEDDIDNDNSRLIAIISEEIKKNESNNSLNRSSINSVKTLELRDAIEGKSFDDTVSSHSSDNFNNNKIDNTDDSDLGYSTEISTSMV